MYRKEVNEQSPIRILEQSIRGGLGKGNLGVIMARAGIGKSAILVQIGLDDLLRDRTVLHISLDQTMENVRSWYDALFADLVQRTNMQDPAEAQATIEKNRMIASFTDQDLWPARLEKTVELFRSQLDFKPSAILVDGHPWDFYEVTENAAMIGAFKAYAKLIGAELWMSAQTLSGPTPESPTGLPAPVDACARLVDVALHLEPEGGDVVVRILKDHDNPQPPLLELRLHPDTLRLVKTDEPRVPPRVRPPASFTLLSGAAPGAEDEFGACAEAWGLSELNFTFEGRSPVRRRGLVQLSSVELEQGAVSPMYVRAHMHRDYPDTPHFKKTLASIWHQVSTAGEIFAIGVIQPDKTVKGGTGWAVELARNWQKPVFVYDQKKDVWMQWRDHDWHVADNPRISASRFTGTGTRQLSEGGRKAIRDLFERSFGRLGTVR